MSIITISRASHSKGKEIAEKTAEQLGYKCMSHDIILETSHEFNTPAIKLIRALHDAPSVLRRFHGGKEKYVSFIAAVLLKHLTEDNIVYHGLAGHFFVKDIPHVLKVRIIADMDDRVDLEMKREGIPQRMARRILKKDDEERRKWSLHHYGIDTTDCSLYDLIIHVHDGKITVDEAADIICKTVKEDHFRTTPASQAAMEDLALSAEVKAASWHVGYEVDISVEDGVLYVNAEIPPGRESVLSKELTNISKNIRGIKDIKLFAVPSLR